MIAKYELRVGRHVRVYMEMPVTGTIWYHYKCFWKLQLSDREWSEFSGIADLKLEDQQMLHMEVVGRPMEPSQLAKNTKNIKNIEIKELILKL